MADVNLIWKNETYKVYPPPAATCFTYIAKTTIDGKIECETCKVNHTVAAPSALAEGSYLRAPEIIKTAELTTAASVCKEIVFAAWNKKALLNTKHATTTGIAAPQSIINEYALALANEKQTRTNFLSLFDKETFDDVCNKGLSDSTIPLTTFCPAPNDQTLYFARAFFHLIKDIELPSGCFAVGKLKGENTIKIAFSGKKENAESSIDQTTAAKNTLQLFSGGEISLLPAANDLWSTFVNEFKTPSGKPAKLTVKNCAESKLFADRAFQYDSVVVVWLGSDLMPEHYALNNKRSKGDLMLPCDSCRGFLAHHLTDRGLHH
jgi:hypothetical protein